MEDKGLTKAVLDFENYIDKYGELDDVKVMETVNAYVRNALEDINMLVDKENLNETVVFLTDMIKEATAKTIKTVAQAEDG